MGAVNNPAIDRPAGGMDFSPEALAAANIHPETRLATDYLNHFNEVVMLFELLPQMREIAQDIRAWTPRSYTDHFRASTFKDRELAIAAYDTVRPSHREAFERTIAALDATLGHARDLLDRATSPGDEIFRMIKDVLDGKVKPLLSHAMALINDTPDLPAEDYSETAQDNIDAMFSA